MQKKQIFILSLAFLIIISAGLYCMFLKSNKKPIIEEQKTEIKDIDIEDKKILDDTNPFKIDITYPEIAEHDDFNNLVKNIIDAKVSEFKANSLENDNSVKEIDPESYSNFPREYDLLITYDKGQIDNDVASVVLDIYSFTGGAHGLQSHFALNYDFKNKKEIKLADIFSEKENYLQTISNYCILELTKQITQNAGSTEGSWIQDGAGPIAENFKTFLIDKNSITFYFEQYQVAPYAWGNFKIVMPR
jgi:hypothetical protein